MTDENQLLLDDGRGKALRVQIGDWAFFVGYMNGSSSDNQ